MDIEQEPAYKMILTRNSKFIVVLSLKGLRAVPLTTPLTVNSEFFLVVVDKETKKKIQI